MDAGTAVTGIFFTCLIAALYFTPSIIAVLRKHHNTGAVIALNTVLGWTFIGWIIAFIWSFTNKA
jgi:hypothetical protein